jgi:hypothetical protein
MVSGAFLHLEQFQQTDESAGALMGPRSPTFDHVCQEGEPKSNVSGPATAIFHNIRVANDRCRRKAVADVQTLDLAGWTWLKLPHDGLDRNNSPIK